MLRWGGGGGGGLRCHSVLDFSSVLKDFMSDADEVRDSQDTDTDENRLGMFTCGIYYY